MVGCSDSSRLPFTDTEKKRVLTLLGLLQNIFQRNSTFISRRSFRYDTNTHTPPDSEPDAPSLLFDLAYELLYHCGKIFGFYMCVSVFSFAL